jgi:transcriptional regulator with XRE-family HTH domain
MANTLGSRIGECRKKKGIKQDQLAEHIGVSPQAVSKWENDLSCPDIALLPQIADYFNITIDELLRGEKSQVVQIVSEEERKDFNKKLLKVYVNSEQGDIVKINLPLGLVKVALEIGMQLPQISCNDTLKNIDFQSILLMAEKGVIGKIVEIKSANGDVVEIVIE